MSEAVPSEEIPREYIEASKGLVAYFVQAPVEAYNLLLKVANELKTAIENTDQYTEYEKRHIMYSLGKLFDIVDAITDLRFFDLYNKYLSEPEIVKSLLIKISLLANVYVKVLDRAYDWQELAKDIDVIASALYLVLRDALEFAASEINKSS